jgi:hypothetical protein
MARIFSTCAGAPPPYVKKSSKQQIRRSAAIRRSSIRFEFVLPNLKIAKALSLDLPPTLRAHADAMIEEELVLR